VDLRKIDLTLIGAKEQLKALAAASGCQYVCIDTHKRKPCVIFTTGNYVEGFAEIICFKEDLESTNLAFMVNNGFSR